MHRDIKSVHFFILYSRKTLNFENNKHLFDFNNNRDNWVL